MRALACLLTLVAAAALADGRYVRTNRRCEAGRSERGLPCDSYAFFEFAPASGAGMGTACACTTPTGARGEAMTFSRTSAATCTKTATGGLSTTGIANGDLVTCSSNQPRVEYGAEGVLGLRVESSRTNSALRSEEFNNAAWLSYTVGVPAITITPDVAVSPSGTLTADRLQIPATTTGQVSSIYQTIGTGAHSVSVYAKGNGQSGSFQIVGFGGTCVTCNYNPTTWTRCGGVVAPAGANIGFANSSHASECSGDTSPKSAVDVFLWGAQAEAGAYATSYIPTTSLAVTRAADDATFSISPTLGNFSLSGSFQTPSTSPVRRLHGALKKDSTNFTASYQTGGTFQGQFVSTAATITWASGLATATTGRAASYFDGTNVGVCINSSCSTQAKGAFSLAGYTNPLTLQIGAYSAGNGELDGIATRVCFAPDSPTRCR